MMAYGSREVQQVAERNSFQNEVKYRRVASTADDPAEKCSAYLMVHCGMRTLVDDGAASDDAADECARFLAAYILGSEFQNRYIENISVFSGLDPLKDGGAGSSMRRLSDAFYRDR